jgi:hypothetical protein
LACADVSQASFARLTGVTALQDASPEILTNALEAAVRLTRNPQSSTQRRHGRR